MMSVFSIAYRQCQVKVLTSRHKRRCKCRETVAILLLRRVNDTERTLDA